jgi:2,3-bisphosphoglycerate-dependent phosphoglycerate mutase
LLLLSNFNAFAQKTNIFIVRVAEKSQPVLAASNVVPGLTNEGHERAEALLKTLKREKIQAIYIPSGKPAEQTVAPIAAKIKVLPRVYTDSISAFINKLTRNFQGTNVLIVAQQKDILPMIGALGLTPPFADLTQDDYDLLFTINIDENDKREVFLSHYGKKHHDTEIPQQYNIDKYNPSFVPPVRNF